MLIMSSMVCEANSLREFLIASLRHSRSEMEISMEEKLYKKMKSVGVSNLVFGIVTIAFGIGAGVMMIVNGARLLAHKSDVLF